MATSELPMQTFIFRIRVGDERWSETFGARVQSTALQKAARRFTKLRRFNHPKIIRIEVLNPAGNCIGAKFTLESTFPKEPIEWIIP